MILKSTSHPHPCGRGKGNFKIVNRNSHFLLQIRIPHKKISNFYLKLFFRFVIDGAVIARNLIFANISRN